MIPLLLALGAIIVVADLGARVEPAQRGVRLRCVVVDGLVVSVVADDWPVKVVVVVFFSIIIDWCVPTESAFDKSDVLSKVFFFFFFFFFFFRCSEGLRARRVVVVVVVALNFCSGGRDVDDATNAI